MGDGGGDVADTARAEWLARVAGIKQWRRGGQRAPHKPLLVLHVLARLIGDRTSRTRYVDLQPTLTKLLREFGPTRKSYKPELPFWHLQSDGFWTISYGDASGGAVEPEPEWGSQSGSPSNRQLIDTQAVGRLDAQLEEALLADSALALAVAQTLLDANWPESLHADICQRVGLDLEGLEAGVAQARVVALGPNKAAAASDRRRDPEFRVQVLRAYDYQCAMCGYDGRLDSTAVGLEAAHVRWWAEGGPDRTDNGLCLCSMHHKLFDRGVLGLAKDREIMVSEQFVSRDRAAEAMVTSLSGQELRAPRSDDDNVTERHRSWHEREVFRGPPR